MHVGWEVGIWWAEGEPTEQQGEVKNPDEIVIDDDDESTPATANPVNPDEILLDDLDDVAAPPPVPPPVPPTRRQAGRREEGSFTQWIALDKCLPKRKFLEFIDVDTSGFVPPASEAEADPSSSSQVSSSSSTPRLTYDPHWLAITRAFHSFISLSRAQKPFPDEPTAREMVSRELDWVKQNVPCGGLVKVEDVQVFSRTAPGPGPDADPGKGKEGNGKKPSPPQVYSNPQTEAFCRMLKVYNFVNREGGDGAS